MHTTTHLDREKKTERGEEEAKAEIEANGESPENYKLYVTRRNTRPEVIKKKRYKVVQQTQNKEETAPKYMGVGGGATTLCDRQLRFLYCNARSLNNKLEHLSALAELYDPDIIGISETWLQEHNYQ